jgi:hypothetical protein
MDWETRDAGTGTQLLPMPDERIRTLLCRHACSRMSFSAERVSRACLFCGFHNRS